MEFAADLSLSEQEKKALLLHWQEVKQAPFNLTAVLEDQEAAVKHYADCLAARPVVEGLDEGELVIDLGSGAGFPGLVLAAVCPKPRFLLLEATAKKCEFLRRTAALMGLSQVDICCARAEEAGRGILRDKAQLVTARAVAPLRELVELSLPLLKKGGRLLAMKGVNFAQEVAEAENALSELAGRIVEAREYQLSSGQGRCLLLVEKIGPTPEKFPRRPGLPHKRPL